MSKQHPAYFAGFFDGEGYVGISAANADRSRLSLRVIVGQKDKAPLELAKSIWGGTVYQRMGKGKRDDYFVWDVKSLKAENFLKDVQPYLIVKKRQVKLALTFRSLVGKNRISEQVAPMAEQLKIKQAISDLNSRVGFGFRGNVRRMV